MKFLKRILQVIVVLVLVFVVGAFLLPREIAVSRTASIAAPPEKIFPLVNSMKSTEQWSPWMTKDPAIKLTYSGPEMGVGNTLEWVSDVPEVGVGSQVITASTTNERVETALDFGAMGKANAYFDLAKSQGGTELTWGFVTDAGYNPMARWMGLMMDRFVGADYEVGLENIKALAEKN